MNKSGNEETSKAGRFGGGRKMGEGMKMYVVRK